MSHERVRYALVAVRLIETRRWLVRSKQLTTRLLLLLILVSGRSIVLGIAMDRHPMLTIWRHAGVLKESWVSLRRRRMRLDVGHKGTGR